MMFSARIRVAFVELFGAAEIGGGDADRTNLARCSSFLSDDSGFALMGQRAAALCPRQERVFNPRPNRRGGTFSMAIGYSSTRGYARYRPLHKLLCDIHVSL